MTTQTVRFMPCCDVYAALLCLYLAISTEEARPQHWQLTVPLSVEEKSNREIKRERNEHTSLMISQLKQDCPRPEVVEVWDIRARDPKLLVFLKSYRNTVPVPRHWSQKRKYLQGKRGIEKPPFELPSFIGATGTFCYSALCWLLPIHKVLVGDRLPQQILLQILLRLGVCGSVYHRL